MGDIVLRSADEHAVEAERLLCRATPEEIAKTIVAALGADRAGEVDYTAHRDVELCLIARAQVHATLALQERINIVTAFPCDDHPELRVRRWSWS